MSIAPDSILDGLRKLYQLFDLSHLPVPISTGLGKVRVERFEITQSDMLSIMLRAAVHPGEARRMPAAGWYTRLLIDGQIVMSDTRAEMNDHLPALRAVLRAVEREPDDARVLINGLGLGMFAAAAIRAGAKHVDVVEVNPYVIEAVGYDLDRLAAAAGVSLTIHHCDALQKTWKPRTRWSYVWHDIWPTITSDNLPSIHRLKRMYARHCDEQGVWAEDEVAYHKRLSR